jgi:outer membrane protein TolC
VLVDVTPGKLSELLTLEAGQLPDFPGLPKLISPQELLRNRPDLRRAERELAAATADIGSATAELYPRFFVSGVLGLESLSIEDLVRFDSLMWRLGPQVRWRIFRRRQLQAQVDAAEARHSQAIANYERSVLLALQEVEDALTGLRNHRSRSASLRIATESHRDTADKERARWRSGLTDRGALLRARIQLQRALEKLLASRAESLLSLVDTYRAQGYSLPDSGESQP